MFENFEASVERELAGRSNVSAKKACGSQLSLRLSNLADIRNILKKQPQDPLALPPATEHLVQVFKACVWRNLLPNGSAQRSVSKGEDLLLSRTAQQTREWLIRLILTQEQFDRTHFTKLFRCALTGSQAGGDMQHLYMVLTAPEIPDAVTRLYYALAMSIELEFAEKHHYAVKVAQQHVEREEAAKTKSANHTSRDLALQRRRIVDKSRASKVDAFASVVVPFNTTASSNPKIDKDCAVCLEPYVDEQHYNMDKTLADYPIRIKYCGHIVGKGCLETWVCLGSIDAAKHPYVTCPMCRVQITERRPPELCDGWISLFADPKGLLDMKRYTGMEAEEMSKAIKMLINEEAAASKLLRVLQTMPGTSVHTKNAVTAEAVLRQKLVEIGCQKKIWGFADEVWATMQRQWLRSDVSGA